MHRDKRDFLHLMWSKALLLQDWGHSSVLVSSSSLRARAAKFSIRVRSCTLWFWWFSIDLLSKYGFSQPPLLAPKSSVHFTILLFALNPLPSTPSKVREEGGKGGGRGMKWEEVFRTPPSTWHLGTKDYGLKNSKRGEGWHQPFW